MGRVIDLDLDNIANTITDNEIVLIDFWADWCQPCKAFSPVYEEASEEYKDIVFTKVDVDAQKEIADDAEIMNIPTLIAFKNGKPVYRSSGALNPQEFGTVLDSLMED
jgi:thioredoxin 1